MEEKKKSYTRQELYDMDPVALYKMVLNNEVTEFPFEYWTTSESRKRIKDILEYLIEVYLRISYTELSKVASRSFFKKYKLGGMYTANNCSTICILNIAFPGKFTVGKLACYNQKLTTIRRDFKWLLGLFKDMPKFQLDIITEEDFIDNNLAYFYDLYYTKGTSIYDIAEDIYPEAIKLYGCPKRKRVKK
ncbi:MAG: DUF4046 domain-containing protein [Cetobacterium sp.]|uniref:DUF4046 domain-containing protein n=1 Tax=Cetobacterium sp. TaxID=2071632 RepID=UPI003F325918